MINGIDIFHGDTITLTALQAMAKNNSLYFAYVKSGTGGSGKDEQFVNYWQICRASGLVCGAYHWFWPSTDPAAQANNFFYQYNLVNTNGTLPPAVDLEWTWNKGDEQTTANELWGKLAPRQRIAVIRQYLDRVESELGIKPAIYTSASFWAEFLEDHTSGDDNTYFAQHPLWLADPNQKNNLPAPWTSGRAMFTQYHFGENGNARDPFSKIDQDSFNGTLLDLLNELQGSYTVTAGPIRSNIVRDIQMVLQSKTFLTDAPDGFFGSHTKNAVTNFQTANELAGTGIIDIQTWRRLLVQPVAG